VILARIRSPGGGGGGSQQQKWNIRATTTTMTCGPCLVPIRLRHSRRRRRRNLLARNAAASITAASPTGLSPSSSRRHLSFVHSIFKSLNILLLLCNIMMILLSRTTPVIVINVNVVLLLLSIEDCDVCDRTNEGMRYYENDRLYSYRISTRLIPVDKQR
jgi:hypothetical protein